MTPGKPRSARRRPCRVPFLLTALLLLLPAPAWPAPSPRFEARWSENPVRPGKPVDLLVTARWEGDAGLFAVRPPRAEPPEGLTAGAVSSRSSQEGGENVVRFRQTFTAPDSGLIPAFSLTVQIFPSGAKEPIEASVETEPLRVDVPRWRGVPVAAVLPGAAALALLLAGGALWALKRRDRRRRKPAPPTEEDGAAVLDGLREQLHACRVRGDTRGFFETALAIQRIVEKEETPEAREIRERAEQARYGNLRLSSEEMGVWARRMKRLAGARPAERAPEATEEP